MSTGMNNGHEAAPIVNGGVMFVSTSFNQVLALDAKSGTVLWRYRSPVPTNARGKPVSRGVALFGDKVFVPPERSRPRRARREDRDEKSGGRSSATTRLAST